MLQAAGLTDVTGKQILLVAVPTQGNRKGCPYSADLMGDNNPFVPVPPDSEAIL